MRSPGGNSFTLAGTTVQETYTCCWT